MRFLVCGLGSMGRRRIRLLKEISSEFMIIGFDKDSKRCNDVSNEFSIDCYDDIYAINLELYDNVIVSTSPLAHEELVRYALVNKKNVFTEINLINDWYDEVNQLSEENKVRLFLSSTLNYRKDIMYIKDVIKNSKCPSSYIYHVGQYLPDWHPWESYKCFFVNDKRTNGCREIFAIDLPWIYKTFGPIRSLNSIHKKNSTLDLSYDDSYIVNVVHENGNIGSIIVDIVSRKAVRHLEVVNEDFQISWSGKPDSVYIYDPNSKVEKNIHVYNSVSKNENYSSNIIENAYKDELLAFINYVKFNDKPIYDFYDDKNVISLIDRIEE